MSAVACLLYVPWSFKEIARQLQRLPPGVRICADRRMASQRPSSAVYLRGMNFSGAVFTFAAQSSQQTVTTAPEGSFTSLPLSLISQSHTEHFFVFIRFDPFQFRSARDATARPARMKPRPACDWSTFKFLLISRRQRGDSLRQADGDNPKAR